MNKKVLVVIVIFALSITLLSGCIGQKAKIFKNEQAKPNRTLSCIPGENLSVNLSNVKVATIYHKVTDRPPAGGRSLDDTINVLKGTCTDFIFLGFWTWTVPAPDSPDNIPPALINRIAEYAKTDPKNVPKLVRMLGYSYEELRNSISAIKKEMPGVIFVGGIPTEALGRVEVNPITNEVIDINNTWQMAFDPKKWNISYECPEDVCRNIPSLKGKILDKEAFQNYFEVTNHLLGPDEVYDWRKAEGYYPDITNTAFQELLVNRAKKQIDSGADGIFVDLLYTQVEALNKMTNDVSHPAVKESYDDAGRIVDAIHDYGKSKGKYIYVGTWAVPVINYAWHPPNLDFVIITPTPEEIESGKFDEAKWDNYNLQVERRFGNIPRFVLLDFGGVGISPTEAFSQNLNKNQQIEWLKKADLFFQSKGMIFIYPVYGGDIFKPGRKILSFGKYPKYDSLAPEFGTYETIKELANMKKR